MDEDKGKNGPWWQPPLLFFAKLNSWIIGPVIIAALLGWWLDRKFGTEPWLFVACIVTAFVVSISKMIQIAKTELKKKKDEHGGETNQH